MKRMLPLILALTIIATGCTAARNAHTLPAQTQPTQTQPGESSPGIPAENEVCLKTDDGSDIAFSLGRAQSDGGYNARAGWTIAWPATQILGHIQFPRPVDPASVKITIDSQDWVPVKAPPSNPDARSVPLVIMPREHADTDPLIMQQGKPGWVTIKVEAATGTDGRPLLEAPASLRIYMWDQAVDGGHPYLGKCLMTISNPVNNVH